MGRGNGKWVSVAKFPLTGVRRVLSSAGVTPKAGREFLPCYKATVTAKENRLRCDLTRRTESCQPGDGCGKIFFFLKNYRELARKADTCMKIHEAQCWGVVTTPVTAKEGVILSWTQVSH